MGQQFDGGPGGGRALCLRPFSRHSRAPRMEPDHPLRKATAVLRQEGPLPTGRGKISGVIAFTLAVLCLLGVLAFHFPEYLTTPELRQKYSVDFIRALMFWSLVIAGGLALANLAMGRNRWLNGSSMVLILLSIAAGGSQVPVGDF